MNLWTDHPIIALGDKPGEEAPVRQVRLLEYDGNKYCRILVDGVEVEIKAGYLYIKPGRLGEVPAWKSEK